MCTLIELKITSDDVHKWRVNHSTQVIQTTS